MVRTSRHSHAIAISVGLILASSCGVPGIEPAGQSPETSAGPTSEPATTEVAPSIPAGSVDAGPASRTSPGAGELESSVEIDALQKFRVAFLETRVGLMEDHIVLPSDLKAVTSRSEFVGEMRISGAATVVTTQLNFEEVEASASEVWVDIPVDSRSLYRGSEVPPALRIKIWSGPEKLVSDGINLADKLAAVVPVGANLIVTFSEVVDGTVRADLGATLLVAADGSILRLDSESADPGFGDIRSIAELREALAAVS